MFSACWLFLLFPLLGCSLTINPQYVPPANTDFTPIYSSTAVSLVNVQKDETVNINGFDTNLRGWTDQIILSLKGWFAANGVQESDSALKTLQISIQETKVLLPENGWPRTDFTLKVETGSGLVRSYPIEANASGLDRAAGYALYYGVLALVHDGSIIHYVSE